MVSSIIGVILMTAITIILFAVISAYVWSIEPSQAMNDAQNIVMHGVNHCYFNSSYYGKC